MMASLFEAIENNLIKDGNYKYLLDGLKTTLIVTGVSLIFSLIIGMLIAVIKDYDKNIDPEDKSVKNILIKILAKIFNLFVTVVRGTPSTIQLLIDRKSTRLNSSH